MPPPPRRSLADFEHHQKPITLFNSVEKRDIIMAVFGDMYVTFRLTFHHFDRFELDLRGDTWAQGAAFPCLRLKLGLRLKLADIVLI